MAVIYGRPQPNSQPGRISSHTSNNIVSCHWLVGCSGVIRSTAISALLVVVVVYVWLISDRHHAPKTMFYIQFQLLQRVFQLAGQGNTFSQFTLFYVQYDFKLTILRSPRWALQYPKYICNREHPGHHNY